MFLKLLLTLLVFGQVLLECSTKPRCRKTTPKVHCPLITCPSDLIYYPGDPEHGICPSCESTTVSESQTTSECPMISCPPYWEYHPGDPHHGVCPYCYEVTTVTPTTECPMVTCPPYWKIHPGDPQHGMCPYCYKVTTASSLSTAA